MSHLQKVSQLLSSMQRGGGNESKCTGSTMVSTDVQTLNMRYSRGPKMTAFHSSILSGHGAPDTPLGGSLESALKSRIKRRRAVSDCTEQRQSDSQAGTDCEKLYYIMSSYHLSSRCGLDCILAPKKQSIITVAVVLAEWWLTADRPDHRRNARR